MYYKLLLLNDTACSPLGDFLEAYYGLPTTKTPEAGYDTRGLTRPFLAYIICYDRAFTPARIKRRAPLWLPGSAELRHLLLRLALRLTHRRKAICLPNDYALLLDLAQKCSRFDAMAALGTRRSDHQFEIWRPKGPGLEC